MKCPHCGMTHTFIDDPDGAGCLTCGCVIYFNREEAKIEGWRYTGLQVEGTLPDAGLDRIQGRLALLD